MYNLKGTIWKIVRNVFLQKTKPFLRVGPVLFGLILIASGFTYAASTQPMYGGTLRVATFTETRAIGYPPEAYHGPDLGMAQAFPAVEALFRFDEGGRPVPWLATNVKEDTKNKSLVITFRKGVKFHDGTDFNAEAVKWNIEQHMAAKSPGTHNLKSIDVVDEYTVRITLLDWDNRVTSSLAVQMGMMISPAAYKKNGKDWAAEHPIGTGPFEFVSRERDVRTTYKKFPGYWQKGKPYLDRIEWYIIGETFTRQAAFRNGEMDVLLFPAVNDIASFEKEGFVVSRYKLGAGARGGVFDSGNPKSPFSNVKVRQAVMHAIDSAAIVKAVYNGEGEASNQFGYKGHWGYNPSVVGYPYNPAKAKQLLAEAGYPNGFKTKLLPRVFPMDQQLFTAIQGFLRDIGIDAQMEPLESGKYNQLALAGGGWEGIIENMMPPDPDLAGYLADKYTGKPGFFISMAVPDDYEKAVQNAITAPDFQQKQKWTQEALKLMTDKYCLLLPVARDYDFVVSHRSVRDTRLNEFMTPTHWTPEDAWLQR